MIFALENKKEYQSLCLEAWELNSAFWDRTRSINAQIRDYILSAIGKLNHTAKIADIGCGNGWLLDELKKTDIDFEYCGIDFNDHFINMLSAKQPENEWHCLDFTQLLPELFKGRFNIVLSCLSIIEMAELKTPFQNFSNMLSKDGTLVLITLNPYFEIVRLNRSYENLEEDIAVFRTGSCAKYYRKEIIIEGEKTGRHYYGVLHSIADLNKSIIANGFSMINFEELNFLGNEGFEPIYNGYILKKNATTD